MLAHQGGWDEILLIVGPILVVVGLLRLLKKRQLLLSLLRMPQVRNRTMPIRNPTTILADFSKKMKD